MKEYVNKEDPAREALVNEIIFEIYDGNRGWKEAIEEIEWAAKEADPGRDYVEHGNILYFDEPIREILEMCGYTDLSDRKANFELYVSATNDAISHILQNRKDFLAD